MSVILFEQAQVNILIGMMRCHHEEIIRPLRYSPYFSHYIVRFQRLDQTVDAEQVADKFIDRMLWYALVSNKVAYALQYHDKVNLEDIDVSYEKTRSIACTKQQLFRELGQLIYNMATNDGNKFIEQKWYEPLEDIYHSLSHFSMQR